MNVLEFIYKNSDRCWALTLEHVWIVFLSIFIATLIAVPTGIVITRNERIAEKVINAANILMTIPSIALFGLMLPFLSIFGQGLGKVPAIIALVLYSQLPIIRNTYTGIKNVPPSLIEAGKGIGMGTWTSSAKLLSRLNNLSLSIIHSFFSSNFPKLYQYFSFIRYSPFPDNPYMMLEILLHPHPFSSTFNQQ